MREVSQSLFSCILVGGGGGQDQVATKRRDLGGEKELVVQRPGGQSGLVGSGVGAGGGQQVQSPEGGRSLICWRNGEQVKWLELSEKGDE